ncbi:hypothetical protein Tco_1375977 [Tanacetum coccineum]
MLCEWRLHEKGADSNPYHDYRNFPIVFCLKINHDGAFTKPPKIGYEGGKVNWINNIDSDAFSVNEVSDMMKKIGYDNVAMEFYFKESNTELDKGIRKLATDSDVLEMLNFVSMYKVIDLYVDHSVYKEPVNVDHSVSKSIILYEPSNSDKFLDNDADEVLNDVSEDEWLEESLRKLPRFSQCGVQSSNNVANVVQARNNVANVFQARRNKNVHNLVITQHVANEANAVSEHESQSEYGSDSDDKWMGCKESVQEVNEMFHDEEDIDFKVFDSGTDLDNEGQEFSNSQLMKDMVTRVSVEQRMPSVDDKPNEASGSAKSNKGTKDSGSLKSKIGSKDSNECPWNSKKMHSFFLSKEVEETIKPNPKIPLSALKDQLPKKLELEVSKMKVYRAKQKATKKVYCHTTKISQRKGNWGVTS